MNKKIALVLGIILVFCGACFLALPAMVNANMLRIIEFAAAQTGFNLLVTNPHLSTGLTFSADEFSIVNKDDSKALYVSKPVVKILPALKKIHVNKFFADAFEVNFVLAQTLKLGDYDIPKLPEVRLKNVQVDEYNVSVKYAGNIVNIGGKDFGIKGFSDKLALQGLKISGAGIDAGLDGEINKINAKFPDLDLGIKVNNANAGHLVTLLPDKDLSQDMDIVHLKKTGFIGSASGQLKIKGSAKAPDITGDITIANAGIPNTTVKTALIKLLFESKQLAMDIVVPVDKEKVSVKGTMELYEDKNVDLDITSTDNVDLNKAQAVLNPLHKILRFDLGPVPMLDLAGVGNIDLHVLGNKKDYDLDGVFNFKNTSAALTGVKNLAVKNAQGSVVFKKQDANFKISAQQDKFKTVLDGVLKPDNLNMTGSVVGPDGVRLPILVRNNTLHFNKINMMFGTMPLLIDGKISDIAVNPDLNLYINTRITQEFLDQFVNATALYPIKVKGDVNVTSRLTGVLDNLNAKSELKLEEDAQIYYMGATIGNPTEPVRINIDSTILPQALKINSLKYDKIVYSQNNRPYPNPQLEMSGVVNFEANDDVRFQDFKVKTQTPTDAKIFNIIFRKPIMKQGLFNSDLTINGMASNPKILGTFDITSIEMPFFDSLITDINMRFKPDVVNITSKGVVVSNPIRLDIVAKNSALPPYVINDLKLTMADLDINKITDMMRDYEVDALRGGTRPTGAQYMDARQLVIKNAAVTADKVTVRNINADNFAAQFGLDEKSVLNVKTFKFDIANGLVNGDLHHNLRNHNSTLNINLRDADASMMTQALFDLKGQIYGSMTGVANLACTGNDYEACLHTLSGRGSFKVADGSMPKLGSLEYLLKAGNLLQGGLSALSFNGLVELFAPLKTGGFESIDGDIAINKGVADRINIYSRGKDLNMYMNGKYNLVSSVADMEIFGSLSKDVTNVLGKLRNASLNSLFNKIPDVEDLPPDSGLSKIPASGNVYRRFIVEVLGDINGSDYIESFKWAK